MYRLAALAILSAVVFFFSPQAKVLPTIGIDQVETVGYTEVPGSSKQGCNWFVEQVW